MQCPKCHYEPTLSEQQTSPDDCVKCGINYQGYARKAAAGQAAVDLRAAELSKMSPSVREAVFNHQGAQPVVVIDIRMGFWSMVIFMVKAAFAAIPAMIIVAAITTLLVALISSVGGLALFGSSAVKSAFKADPLPPMPVSQLEPEPLEVPSDPTAIYTVLDVQQRGGSLVAITTKRIGAKGVVYTRSLVDCSSREVRVLGSGATDWEMNDAKPSQHAIVPSLGSPEDFVVSRACQ